MRTELRKIRVEIASQPVGTLAETPLGEIFFEYDAKWLQTGYSISPFYLPLQPGLQPKRPETTQVFDGLFGVFDDSLPDGWGRLLMDRFFHSRTIALEDITPLNRLSYVGKTGMGALTYHPIIETAGFDQQWLDLDEIAAQAERIVSGSPEEALPALRAAGGSSSGSRPKAFVAYNPVTGKMSSDVLQPGEGFEHWLIKFRAKEDPTDAGNIEAAYALMALAAGINMPETRLFDTPIGRFFGIQRFDWKPGARRIHTHTFGGLIHSSFRHPDRDYHDLLSVAFNLTHEFNQVEEAYRRAVFNVFAHNRDDHVKNFAFIFTQPTGWRLSPAYDLTLSSGINGQHNMTVMGSGNPNEKHLLELAKDQGIDPRKARSILADVSAAIRRWPEFAEKTGVTNKSRANVSSLLSCGEGALPRTLLRMG
jgi:serine/threonine-protein kinase HipA